MDADGMVDRTVTERSLVFSLVTLPHIASPIGRTLSSNGYDPAHRLSERDPLLGLRVDVAGRGFWSARQSATIFETSHGVWLGFVFLDQVVSLERTCPNICPGTHQIDALPNSMGLICLGKDWSEWQDLNLRPPRPERGALPGCATLRLEGRSYSGALIPSQA
jgi:hypothetical protein